MFSKVNEGVHTTYDARHLLEILNADRKAYGGYKCKDIKCLCMKL